MKNIPEGYCQCGCGQKTNTDNKGNYKRFVNHHHILNMRPNYVSSVYPKTCVICGKKFLPQKPSRQTTQVTCSAKCRNVYNSRKSADKRATALRKQGKTKAYRKWHGRHEHRVIMEQIIGRPLNSNEVVHHKDGNFLNNTPENLQLMSKSEHATLHSTKNKVCSVEGCNRKHKSFGFCLLHYRRWKKYGTPELPIKQKTMKGDSYGILGESTTSN